MLTVKEIKKAIENTEYEFYGIRVDEMKYKAGETANNSHQLFQDPDLNEDGELIYPYIDDGIFSGFYDAGELNGTCAIRFDPEDDNSIQEAIDIIKAYYGDFIHVLGGDSATSGNDRGEIIISEAKILLSYILNPEKQ